MQKPPTPWSTPVSGSLWQWVMATTVSGRTLGRAWHPDNVTLCPGLVHLGAAFYSVKTKVIWFASAVSPQCPLCFSAGVSYLVWRVSRGWGWRWRKEIGQDERNSSLEMVVWLWLETCALG